MSEINFAEILNPLITIVITIIVGVMVKLFNSIVSGVSAWTRAKTNSEHLHSFIVVTEQIVTAINQSIVEDTKKAAADGKITSEECKRILDAAKNKAEKEVKESLTKFPEVFQEFVGSKTDKWVEAAVSSVKKKLPPL